MQAKDLKKYYGLQFVTSSLEKKAEAAVIKAKLDEDSTRVPKIDSIDIDASSQKAVDFEKKCPIHPSVAYEIAASAASYVQFSPKGLLCPGLESKEGDGEASFKTEGQPQEEGVSSTRLYNSEVAAYMAASTMTAVVAAGEREKLEAARDLQSLHSSPCEWFVCDDLSTYTRCFVIQVIPTLAVDHMMICRPWIFHLYMSCFGSEEEDLFFELQGSDSLASWQANLFFEPTKFEVTIFSI